MKTPGPDGLTAKFFKHLRKKEHHLYKSFPYGRCPTQSVKAALTRYQNQTDITIKDSYKSIFFMMFFFLNFSK